MRQNALYLLFILLVSCKSVGPVPPPVFERNPYILVLNFYSVESQDPYRKTVEGFHADLENLTLRHTYHKNFDDRVNIDNTVEISKTQVDSIQSWFNAIDPPKKEHLVYGKKDLPRVRYGIYNLNVQFSVQYFGLRPKSSKLDEIEWLHKKLKSLI